MIKLNRNIFSLVIASLCLLGMFFTAIFPTVNSLDSSKRSWASIEVPYFTYNDLLVKMTVYTVGNNLNNSIWIDEITYPITVSKSIGSSGVILPGNASNTTYPTVMSTPTPTVNSNIGVSATATIIISREMVEATYSADSDITTFTYTLPSGQYDIKFIGEFPFDQWQVGIRFHSNFNLTIDSRSKFCTTPSQNYFCSYSTANSAGGNSFTTDLVIKHPSGFANYVSSIFLAPVVIFWALASVLVVVGALLIHVKSKYLDRLVGINVTVCSAVIVFIPVFQLATQDSKGPLVFTWLDGQFALLLATFIAILAITLALKAIALVGDRKREDSNKKIV